MSSIGKVRWVLLGLGLGCADSAPAELPAVPSNEVTNEEADAGRDGGARDAGKSGGSLVDARRPTSSSRSDCTPGHYHGTFECLISGLLPWSGDMDFSLIESSEMQGEFAILEVVPGTRIMGTDNSFEGTFDAELMGKFDCATGVLTGSMEGKYFTPRLGFDLAMTGALGGNYLSDASVGGFTGDMGPLKSPDFDLLGPLAPDATCTWTADRVGEPIYDPVYDAGSRDAGMP